MPECWLRLSKQQRTLVVSGGVALGVLLLCLSVIMAAWFGSTQQHTPQVSTVGDLRGSSCVCPEGTQSHLDSCSCRPIRTN